MPDKWPLANGNWSNAANWNGGTLPVDGDDIFADNRTVTIDIDLNLPTARLWTTARSGGTAGGAFNVTTNRNITVSQVNAGTTSCLNISGTALNLNMQLGTVAGSQTTNGAHGLLITSTGDIAFVSTSFVGGNASNRNGLTCQGNCNVTFTLCSTSGRGGTGMFFQFGSMVNLTGRLDLLQVSGSSQPAFDSSSIINCNLTGNVNHQGTASTFRSTGVTTGSYTCLSQSAVGSNLISNGNNGLWHIASANSVFSITANSLLTLPSGNLIFANGVDAIVNYTGDVKVTSNECHFVLTNLTGTVVHQSGKLVGPDSAFLNCGVRISASGGTERVILNNLEAGLNGHLPSIHNNCRFKPTSQIITRDNSNAPLTMVSSAAVGDPPLQSNVRAGIVYHFGTLTGTCAVPAAGSVAAGVPVDATTGTAVLTQAAVQAALIAGDVATRADVEDASVL